MQTGVPESTRSSPRATTAPGEAANARPTITKSLTPDDYYIDGNADTLVAGQFNYGTSNNQTYSNAYMTYLTGQLGLWPPVVSYHPYDDVVMGGKDN